MKICMFTPGWLPVHKNYGAGGIEVHVEDLVTGLIKEGNEVTVITSKHHDEITKEEFENLTIFFVGDSPLSCNKNYYRESVELFKILNENEKFDIVHTQDYAGYGYELSECKVPSVVTCHGTPINMVRSMIQTYSYKSFIKLPFWVKAHYFVAPLLFSKPNKIIAVSGGLKQDIINQYNIPEQRIKIIPNAVDINRFTPRNVDLNKHLGIEKMKIVLFVGVISKRKGVHILLKAFKKVLHSRNDVILIIIGQGPYLPKLKKLSKEIGIDQNVIFTGRVSSEQLPDYYNISDVSILPSIGAESFGIVIAEAMASGKPIIASNIGAIPTVIEHLIDGVLVEPGNPKELCDKILELLNNENMAVNMGKRGRKKAESEFSLDSMIENTIKVYEACIKNKF